MFDRLRALITDIAQEKAAHDGLAAPASVHFHAAANDLQAAMLQVRDGLMAEASAAVAAVAKAVAPAPAAPAPAQPEPPPAPDNPEPVEEAPEPSPAADVAAAIEASAQEEGAQPGEGTGVSDTPAQPEPAAQE